MFRAEITKLLIFTSSKSFEIVIGWGRPAGGHPVERPHYTLWKRSVILPIYNEEENIETVVYSIMHFLPTVVDKFEIILVDDGSSDSTYSILRALYKRLPCIRVIHHYKNIGYGSALTSGFKVAKFQFILFMDSDTQFDISEINKFFPYIETYDIVIGCRIERQENISIRLNPATNQSANTFYLIYRRPPI